MATVSGPARSVRSILTAERVALNFAGPLSGTATATAALVKAVEGTAARIICTRKTLPGLRVLQKYAVRCGGGFNHRFGLDDAAMVKDNHVQAAGGIGPAVARLRAGLGHMVRIEVEVDRLDQLEEALSLGVDTILLDNMALDNMRRAVALAKGRAVLEASGNVTLATVRAIAETGVDYISSGAITHIRAESSMLDWIFRVLLMDIGLGFLTSHAGWAARKRAFRPLCLRWRLPGRCPALRGNGIMGSRNSRARRVAIEDVIADLGGLVHRVGPVGRNRCRMEVQCPAGGGS